MLFHTPKQKLPVAGSRPEFIISVPSLCHWTYPASSVVPSGGLRGNGLPALPFATNVNFHSPTIDASRSRSPSRPLSGSGAANKVNLYETEVRSGRRGGGANFGFRPCPV